jgi:predicted ATP-grasp superfamily ATP-dependent carboligase
MSDENILSKILIQIARKCKSKPVLFLTNDKHVLMVARNRELFQEYYNFILPDTKIVETLIDKEKFAHYASFKNMPIPSTIIIRNKAELVEIVDKLNYPCIMKPSIKTALWDTYSGSDKAFRINSEEELLNNANQYFSNLTSPLIIQDWIEGVESEIYFCLVYYDKTSRCKAHFTGRKLLQWPFETGSSCIAESIDNRSVLLNTLNFFDSLRFIGFGSVEFKRDINNGAYYIVEPTVGRSDLQSSIALGSNINMPLIYYCELTKQKHFKGKPCKRKVTWIKEDSLLSFMSRKNILKYIKFKTWLRIIRGKKVFTLFYFDDPMPFVFLLSSIFVKITRTFLFPIKLKNANDRSC